MSVATHPPAMAADQHSNATGIVATTTTEPCPLCGSPLVPTQEWCLSCGAAARTRLAATPAWRAPLILLAIVIVLALAALTVALVYLAGQ